MPRTLLTAPLLDALDAGCSIERVDQPGVSLTEDEAWAAFQQGDVLVVRPPAQ